MRRHCLSPCAGRSIILFFKKQKTGYGTEFYIFFDVDGVLNCKADWIARFSLNRNCLDAFGELHRALSEKYLPVYIISSTWRAGKGDMKSNDAAQYEMLTDRLLAYGIKVSGSTPISSKGRQREIEYYLRRNCGDTDNYLVLDDDVSLFERPEEIHLFCTDHNTGLTRENVKQIKKKI